MEREVMGLYEGGLSNEKMRNCVTECRLPWNPVLRYASLLRSRGFDLRNSLIVAVHPCQQSQRLRFMLAFASREHSSCNRSRAPSRRNRESAQRRHELSATFLAGLLVCQPSLF